MYRKLYLLFKYVVVYTLCVCVSAPFLYEDHVQCTHGSAYPAYSTLQCTLCLQVRYSVLSVYRYAAVYPLFTGKLQCTICLQVRYSVHSVYMNATVYNLFTSTIQCTLCLPGSLQCSLCLQVRCSVDLLFVDRYVAVYTLVSISVLRYMTIEHSVYK